MKRVVIESPYGANPEKFGPYLVECIRDSLQRGEAPIASVATFALSGALKEALPNERRLGMEAGWAWIEKADLVAVYLDHGTSAGMTLGIGEAEKYGVAVELRFLYPDKASQP